MSDETKIKLFANNIFKNVILINAIRNQTDFNLLKSYRLQLREGHEQFLTELPVGTIEVRPKPRSNNAG